MKSAVIENGKFMIDGKTEQIISGAIHYFRVIPELWEDRLLKARQCGLNAIETYMCWNLHEPQEGKFNFDGLLDFEKFIRTADKLGLWVIIRPGPYICAEWENGGFPAWLMVKEGLRLRCMNKTYLNAFEPFLNIILPRLKKLQYPDGPVIAMQVENEYGSFGNDREYIRHIRQIYINNGIKIPLFTSDGPEDFLIHGGTIPELTMTLNFGANPERAFTNGRRHRPEGPDCCMEFWNGWFDHWGEEHHLRNAGDAAETLDNMLKKGANVNLYMFHGGTNFNFWNGANYADNKLQPTITSYDYDAALNECGDPTDKYFAFQKVIKKYNKSARYCTPEPSPKKAYGEIALTESARLLDNLNTLSKKYESVTPEPMEYWGQNFGFIHYRTKLMGPVHGRKLVLEEVRDRAMIFIDGRYMTTYYRNDETNEFEIDIASGEAQLDILVENMGRINYGPRTGKDFKGILGGIRICLQYQYNWETRPLAMDNIDRLVYGDFLHESDSPAFHRGILKIEEAADTFLNFPGIKGCVWVNGFNIGRYWDQGPQKTLYIPGPLLKNGNNEIIVFELHELYSDKLKFSDIHKLG